MTTTRAHGRFRMSITGMSLLALATAAGCGGGSTVAPTPTSGGPTRSAGLPGLPTTPARPATAVTSPPTSTASPGTGAGQAPVPVESNPPGDIPDNLAFVPYRNAAAGYSFTYPEGWAHLDSGTAVAFTDKLNGISADTADAPANPTVDAVRAREVPRLQQTQPAFEFGTVEPVTLPAGEGVRVVYRRNSTPDPVTGRQVRDEVESYLIAMAGKAVRLDVFGPVGADNVDAYRTISRSLRLS